MSPIPTFLIEFLQQASVLGVVVLVFWAIFQGWLVLGREYKREKERADKFEAYYDQSITMLNTTLQETQRQAQSLRDQVDLLAHMKSNER